MDSGADGEIILGRPFGGDSGNRDHLAGFVSLDFDGFTPGKQGQDVSLLLWDWSFMAKEVSLVMADPLHSLVVKTSCSCLTPGDREDKNKKTKKAQEKEKLSIIVGGKSPAKPKAPVSYTHLTLHIVGSVRCV